MHRFDKKPLIPWFVLFSLGISSLCAAPWQTFQNCLLLPNEANDGDSFHVRANGKEYIFRLCFVDAPETDNSFPERVAEQAKYFHLTRAQTLQVGKEAEQYTREKLSRPFTIETCLEDAKGRSRLPRYFAFVEIGKEDLAEDLVAQGLARIYGAPGHPPDRSAPSAEKLKLQQLERMARAGRIGAWSLANGLPAAHPSPTPDSFAAFFHQPTPTPTPSPSAFTPASDQKFDINSASSEALQSIPGIGPVLASRIIAARPYKNADELQRVPGIGPKRYEALRRYFR